MSLIWNMVEGKLCIQGRQYHLHGVNENVAPAGLLVPQSESHVSGAPSKWSGISSAALHTAHMAVLTQTWVMRKTGFMMFCTNYVSRICPSLNMT